MPFRIDGISHANGVSNEKQLVNFLNTDSTVLRRHLLSTDQYFEHRGGTGQKADAAIVDVDGREVELISIKKHESKSGSFDWLNSSNAVKGLLKTNLQTGLATIKQSYANHKNLDQSRLEVTALLQANMLMDSDFIKHMLHAIYLANPKYIMINCCARKEIVLFDREELLELKTYADHSYFIKMGRGKTSAQIWRNKDGVNVDTHLRIRLVLNNGVTALLGVSEKNKTSIPCIKIQQDKVDAMIAGLRATVREAYYSASGASGASGASS